MSKFIVKRLSLMLCQGVGNTVMFARGLLLILSQKRLLLICEGLVADFSRGFLCLILTVLIFAIVLFLCEKI